MRRFALLPAVIGIFAGCGVLASAQQAPYTEETAVAGADVANSVGINVHLNYPSYASRFADVKHALLDLGVRHVRNSLGNGDPAQGIASMNDLGKSGVKSDVLFDVRTSAAAVDADMERLQPAIELAEGANELDAARYPDWRNAVVADQKKLYPIAHARHLGVVGPVTTSYQATQQVGDLGAYLDYGNMHNYFAGFNPGTTGWGGVVDGTVFGSLAYNKKLAALISGTKPVMSTETGYCTLAGVRGAVTPAIAARYLPRLFLEQWNGGVVRTYVYELLDEGRPGCDASLGLLHQDFTPKPGYAAVRSFMRTIGTYRADAAPARVGLRLSGNLDRIHHTLVQTRRNEAELFVWNESPSWDVHAGTGAPIAVAPRDIVVAIRDPWHVVNVRMFGDDGLLINAPVQRDGASTVVPVADRVTAVLLRRE